MVTKKHVIKSRLGGEIVISQSDEDKIIFIDGTKHYMSVSTLEKLDKLMNEIVNSLEYRRAVYDTPGLVHEVSFYEFCDKEISRIKFWADNDLEKSRQ